MLISQVYFRGFLWEIIFSIKLLTEVTFLAFYVTLLAIKIILLTSGRDIFMDGWILVSAPDESSSVSECWNGREWIDISSLNHAKLFLVSDGATIEKMRSQKAERQARHTDKDIRIATIALNITLSQVLN